MLNPATPWSYIRRWRSSLASEWPGCLHVCYDDTISHLQNYASKDKREIQLFSHLCLLFFFYLSFTLLHLSASPPAFHQSAAVAVVCHALLISSWKMGIDGGSGGWGLSLAVDS